MVNDDHTTEVWKAVVEFEGFYEVSSRGQVRRVAAGPSTYNGRLLKPTLHKSGYIYVGLTKDGRRKTCKVHVLLCEAFHGPKPDVPYACVRHRNDVKADNRVENICWGTMAENTADAIRFGTFGIGEKNGNALFSQVEVEQIRERYRCLLAERKAQGFKRVPRGTLIAWAKEYGVSPFTIGSLAVGRTYA